MAPPFLRLCEGIWGWGKCGGEVGGAAWWFGMRMFLTVFSNLWSELVRLLPGRNQGASVHRDS